jgi:hypothetical protein
MDLMDVLLAFGAGAALMAALHEGVFDAGGSKAWARLLGVVGAISVLLIIVDAIVTN